jgi:hypothetical protein
MALGLGDDDTKVTTASRRGSGKINSHLINLTLPVNPSIAFFRDENIAKSNLTDTRISNPHSASYRKQTQQIFSALPLLCHKQKALGK